MITISGVFLCNFLGILSWKEVRNDACTGNSNYGAAMALQIIVPGGPVKTKNVQKSRFGTNE
jgi:hypothetical protein